MINDRYQPQQYINNQCLCLAIEEITQTYFNFGCTVKMICERGGAQSTFPRNRFCQWQSNNHQPVDKL